MKSKAVPEFPHNSLLCVLKSEKQTLTSRAGSTHKKKNLHFFLDLYVHKSFSTILNTFGLEKSKPIAATPSG